MPTTAQTARKSGTGAVKPERPPNSRKRRKPKVPRARVAAPVQSIGTSLSPPDFRSVRHEAVVPIIARGRSPANTERHPNASMSGPPATRARTGAPVMVIWNQPIASPRCSRGCAAMMSAIPVGMVAEMARPTSMRAATNAPADGASAQARVPSPSSTAPMRNIFRWP